MKILEAHQQQAIRKAGGYRAFITSVYQNRWGEDAPAIRWKTQGQAVYAKVVKSDWIAQCPTCPGATVVMVGEPFFCPDCANAENAGHARRVIWPEDKRQIETILLERKNPNTRNWSPDESLGDLIAENIEHGERIL